MTPMRILSPIDRADELNALADAGADEFYAGLVPPFWAEAFGPVVVEALGWAAAATFAATAGTSRIATWKPSAEPSLRASTSRWRRLARWFASPRRTSPTR